MHTLTALFVHPLILYKGDSSQERHGDEGPMAALLTGAKQATYSPELLSALAFWITHPLLFLDIVCYLAACFPIRLGSDSLGH